MTAGKKYYPLDEPYATGNWNNRRPEDGLNNSYHRLEASNFIQDGKQLQDARFWVALRDEDLWYHKDAPEDKRSVKLFLRGTRSHDLQVQSGNIVLSGIIVGRDNGVQNTYNRGLQNIPRDLDQRNRFQNERQVAYNMQQKYSPNEVYSANWQTYGQATYTQKSINLDCKDNVGGDGVPFGDGYLYDLTEMVNEMAQAPERDAIPFVYPPNYGGWADENGRYHHVHAGESKFWFVFAARATQQVSHSRTFVPPSGPYGIGYTGAYFDVVAPRNFDLSLYGLKSVESKSEVHPSHPDKGIGDSHENEGEKVWYSPPVWENVDTDGDEGIPGKGYTFVKTSTDLSDFIGRKGEGSRNLDNSAKQWSGSVNSGWSAGGLASHPGSFEYNAPVSDSYTDGVPRLGINQYHYKSFARTAVNPLGISGRELTVSFWAKHDVTAGQAVGSFPYFDITKGKTYAVFGSRTQSNLGVYGQDTTYDPNAYGFEIRIGITSSNNPIIKVVWHDRYHWVQPSTTNSFGQEIDPLGQYRGGRSSQLGTYGTPSNYWQTAGYVSDFDPTGDGYNHYLVKLRYSGAYEEVTERSTPNFWSAYVNGKPMPTGSSDFRLARSEFSLEHGYNVSNVYYWQPQVLTYTRTKYRYSLTDEQIESFSSGHGLHRAEVYNIGRVNYREPDTELFSGLMDDTRMYDYGDISASQIRELASERLANNRRVSMSNILKSLQINSEASSPDVVMRNLMMREGGSQSVAEASELSLSISNFAAADSVDVASSCQDVDMPVPATADSAESSSECPVFGVAYSALAGAESVQAATQASRVKVDISGAASPDVVESRSQASSMSLDVDRTLDGIGGETCWISPSRDNDNEDTSVTENFVALQENIQVQSGQWLDDSVDGGDHSFEIGKSPTQSQGRVQLPGGIF